jgi:hypothetical protein
MKKTVTGIALGIMALVLATSLAFALEGEGKGKSTRGWNKTAKVIERETPEMKVVRHKFYEARIEALKLAVKNGKVEQARADFMLKRMANQQAFKDANPEWTKYDRRGHGMKAGKRGGRGNCDGAGRRGGRRDGKHGWDKEGK